jgi:uncharacterized membrane protein
MAAWMGPDAWLWMGAWVLVLFVFVWLLARDPRPPGRAAGLPRDEAMETLRTRFARGELTEEEFDRASALLGRQTGSRKAP